MPTAQLRFTGFGCVLAALSTVSCASTVPDEGTQQVAANPAPLDKVDLLFVIDNSNTMHGEDARLNERLPHMVEILSGGQRAPNSTQRPVPVRDLHVGVVSSDMGITSDLVRPSCAANGGDDGKLQHLGAPEVDSTCVAEYPLFLSYREGSSERSQLVHDFRCIATLGTGACSVEQPLEATLKALSPRAYSGANSGEPAPRFLAESELGTWGRGDLSPKHGGNEGFLRDDSLLMIVLLTDEDDCSIQDTAQLKLDDRREQDTDLGEDLNQGCVQGTGLHDVRDRYLKGLRALRPGREDLVKFVAIAGVPPDLVDNDVLAATDFADPKARDEFYDTILSDNRMQPGVDRSQSSGPGRVILRPSCVTPPGAGETRPHTAFPPRRIVELAKSFGPHGMVQSICADDFQPALDTLLNTMITSSP